MGRLTERASQRQQQLAHNILVFQFFRFSWPASGGSLTLKFDWRKPSSEHHRPYRVWFFPRCRYYRVVFPLLLYFFSVSSPASHRLITGTQLWGGYRALPYIHYLCLSRVVFRVELFKFLPFSSGISSGILGGYTISDYSYRIQTLLLQSLWILPVHTSRVS